MPNPPLWNYQGSTTTIYNPYANMHDVIEAPVEWFTSNGYHISGIIHVGANDGKELAWYVTKKYQPILAFEPHPQAFEELKKHYWNHAISWNLALGSESGSLQLYIPEDGDTEKSSKYKSIPTEGHNWTNIPIGSTIIVPVIRFDLWAVRGGIDLSPFNTVVIDVQGMELEVLQGFGLYLGVFDFLVIECSKKPVYDGESSAQEVVDWLEENGFRAVSPIEEHDNIFFVRKSL